MRKKFVFPHVSGRKDSYQPLGNPTVVPRLGDSSTAATKKIFKVPDFYRAATLLVPRFLVPRFLQSNNSSSQDAAAAAAAAAAASSSSSSSSSILQPLLSRITPGVVGFLRRSTTEGAVEDNENGGGIISRILRSRRGGGGGGGEGPRASFHEPQKKILIAEGLPTPPVGSWYRITPPSLAFVESLATQKEDLKKEIANMDSGSSGYLAGFSAIMFGFVASMEKMVPNCDHVVLVVFIVFFAVAYELLLGYLAVSQMGNNFWKFNALKGEVLGLKVQMEQQLREMVVNDYEDKSNRGFHALVFSCKLIIEPLGFSKMIVFQILSLLLMLITVGFTINNVFIQWKKMC